MKALIPLLFRAVVALVPVDAMIALALRKFVTAVVFGVVVAVLSLAALTFFYVFLDRWLAARYGDDVAAATLCGANILLVVIVLAVRAILRSRPARPSRNSEDKLGILQSDLETGIEIGRNLREKVSKSAPELALAAGLIGFIIGLRPQILGAFAGKRRADKSSEP